MLSPSSSRALSLNDPDVILKESELRSYQDDRKILGLVKKQVDIFSLLAVTEKPENERLVLLLGILDSIFKSKGIKGPPPPKVSLKLPPAVLDKEPNKNAKTEEISEPDMITLSSDEEVFEEEDRHETDGYDEIPGNLGNDENERTLRIVNLKSLASTLPMTRNQNQKSEETSRALVIKSVYDNSKIAPDNNIKNRRSTIGLNFHSKRLPNNNNNNSSNNQGTESDGLRPELVKSHSTSSLTSTSSFNSKGGTGNSKKIVLQTKAEYYMDDRVFAKIRGYPPWPAKIVQKQEMPTEKYVVEFYGSHDIARVTRKMLVPMNEGTLKLFGNPGKTFRKADQFKLGLKEVMDEVAAEAAVKNVTPMTQPKPKQQQQSQQQQLIRPKKCSSESGKHKWGSMGSEWLTLGPKKKKECPSSSLSRSPSVTSLSSQSSSSVAMDPTMPVLVSNEDTVEDTGQGQRVTMRRPRSVRPSIRPKRFEDAYEDDFTFESHVHQTTTEKLEVHSQSRCSQGAQGMDHESRVMRQIEKTTDQTMKFKIPKVVLKDILHKRALAKQAAIIN